MGVIRNKIPWNLRQRGSLDSDRHAKKVHKAIRDNLRSVIAEESIITTDGKRTIRVPIRYLDSYYFKHGKPGDGVGHGPGEPGDVLHEGKKRQPGGGRQAGQEGGDDVYEAEISVDELTKMMLEDLSLPYLEKKDKVEIVTKKTVFNDVRKTGIMANWLKKKTVLENMKRNAIENGKAEFADINQEDMRYRTWDEKIQRFSNAVVYLMMDRSGSMDDHKRYLCKATFWWICRFLETKYDYVDVVFIAHDTEARIVPEKDFFTISNSGGTRCSSAYDLCWSDIKESRPASIWNVYCFHFSDGDNWAEDDVRCTKLVKAMLERVNMFAYGEVAWENSAWVTDSTLRKALETIRHPRLMTAVMKQKGDVYPTLAKFLNKELSEKRGPA
jgi:hypothetical protein